MKMLGIGVVWFGGNDKVGEYKLVVVADRVGDGQTTFILAIMIIGLTNDWIQPRKRSPRQDFLFDVVGYGCDVGLVMLQLK